jgi:hypothetical protein
MDASQNDLETIRRMPAELAIRIDRRLQIDGQSPAELRGQQLDRGYRIVSFIILGGLLLAISFL